MCTGQWAATEWKIVGFEEPWQERFWQELLHIIKHGLEHSQETMKKKAAWTMVG